LYALADGHVLFTIKGAAQKQFVNVVPVAAE
jgi:large subunit ribosomal protein L27